MKCQQNCSINFSITYSKYSPTDDVQFNRIKIELLINMAPFICIYVCQLEVIIHNNDCQAEFLNYDITAEILWSPLIIVIGPPDENISCYEPFSIEYA